MSDTDKTSCGVHLGCYEMATVGEVNRSREHEAHPRLHLVSRLICEPILPLSHMLPHYLFIYLFISQSDLFYLLIVRVEGYCCTLSHSVRHTHTHTYTHLAELLWTSDRPVAETYTLQHNIYKRQTSMASAGIEPAVPTSEWLQSYAIDRAAPRIGCLHFARLT